jgi:chromosomal replication initiation ATPase DnaA
MTRTIEMPDEKPRRARPANAQLTLNLAPNPGYERENFFVSGSNEQAYTMIELWPSWPSPTLLILGPSGAGKSHLGAIWASVAKAGIQSAASLATEDIEALAAAGPLLLEDADAIGQSEVQLFHLVNLMRERGTALVLTAKTPPDAWGLQTADLVSRLRLAPTAVIGPPDDALLRAVLVKLLIDRQLVVDTGVVGYIALRIERSLDAARSFIDALDREALARQSRISRAIAGDVLLAMGFGGKQGPSREEGDCSDNDVDGDQLPMTLPLTVRRSGSSGLGGL